MPAALFCRRARDSGLTFLARAKKSQQKKERRQSPFVGKFVPPKGRTSSAILALRVFGRLLPS
jgi:hypothetical protein